MSRTLLACPFCRELYERDESELCRVCGVALKPLADLPPSLEVQLELEREFELIPPEDRPLPWHDLGRLRGPLVLGCALGLAAFFTPWLELTQPETVSLSGFELAETRGTWFAGGAVGWFVCIPLALSRRSVRQMRGVRLILALFCALTACQASVLWLFSPTEAVIPLRYEWGWGIHLSFALSLATTALALGFGGTRPPNERPDLAAMAPTPDETLH